MIDGKIRLATKEDINKITILYNSDLKNLSGDNKTRIHKEDIEDYFKNKLNKIFIYEIDKRIAGFLIAQFWRHYIHLHIIIINEKYRRQGIGEELIGYLEKLAKKQDKYFLDLFTEINNKNMKNLLKKRKYQSGNKFIFYSKKLR